jgi:cytidine deaminase
MSLTPEQSNLMNAARTAASHAYAPYSKFRVGAAVLTDGGVFYGANIENACTNLGICAERAAICHARMNGYTNILGIAVNCVDALVDTSGQVSRNLAMPCGGCRQWMAELAPDAWLITNASEQVYTLSDLLPTPFTLTHE